MNWIELLNEERPSGDKFLENEQLNLSPFERDYYTIVGSSYFRRLQKKTQVYTLDENDFIRNRLTHSLEVSSIAEMLGKRVAKRIIENGENSIPPDFQEKLSMVLRCAGLLHDIGNPPFGHSGEEYIRDFFENNENELRQDMPEQMWLDFVNYEGNAHNLRIITKLGQSSNPSDDRYGMDLTNAVINSVIKYPYNSLVYNNREVGLNGKRKRGKIGFYFAEEWVLTMNSSRAGVLRKTGTLIEQDGCKKILRNPIMLLMEAADDIAYATADVEDAVKKGKITIKDFWSTISGEQQESEKTISGVQRKLKIIREAAMEHVIDSFMENYDVIMSGDYGPENELIDNCIYNLGELKSLLINIFSERDSITEYRYNSKRRINDILGMLIKAVKRKRNNDELSFEEFLLLNEMQQYLDKAGAEVGNYKNMSAEEKRQANLYHDYLAVVDFVSGMTDAYVGTFMDDWNNADYVMKKKDDYKRKCIDKITQISSYKMADKIFSEFECVDNWDNLQMSIILQCYATNDQINGALEYNESAKQILINIAKQYNKFESTILSESEWQLIIEKLELNFDEERD